MSKLQYFLLSLAMVICFLIGLYGGEILDQIGRAFGQIIRS